MDTNFTSMFLFLANKQATMFDTEDMIFPCVLATVCGVVIGFCISALIFDIQSINAVTKTKTKTMSISLPPVDVHLKKEMTLTVDGNPQCTWNVFPAHRLRNGDLTRRAVLTLPEKSPFNNVESAVKCVKYDAKQKISISAQLFMTCSSKVHVLHKTIKPYDKSINDVDWNHFEDMTLHKLYFTTKMVEEEEEEEEEEDDDVQF